MVHGFWGSIKIEFWEVEELTLDFTLVELLQI